MTQDLPSNRRATLVHASTVAVDGRGLLILGASARGKSALALQMMAFGASLVADDQTHLSRREDTLIARAPSSTRGMIEARGVGLLNASTVEGSEIVLAVDLDQHEVDRLPVLHEIEMCGVKLPCLYSIDGAHFPAAVLQYLKAGRREPS
ncbi:HPr kinase/phosphorylase [Roseobacter weihaiensis]|uniref:HPr kinase/phosphorylase n=1 Tax=Roseobacter weihaiensis TaxID=2763262 RepID=UPI001D0A710D|nr:HPr kinase/phosphatase C-terminal domain-containing protein [Roseobacter sp. H9]